MRLDLIMEDKTVVQKKCYYDEKHDCYKLRYNFNIPQEYLKHLIIEDLMWDYKVSYDNISFDKIKEYSSEYFIYGVDGLDGLNDEEISSFKDFYSLPHSVIKNYFIIFDNICNLSLGELYESTLERIIT